MIENLSKLRSAKKAPDKDPKRRKSNVETNKSNDDSKKTPKKETDNKAKQLQPTEKKSFDKEEAKKQRRITDKRNDKSSKNADSHEEVDVEQQSSSASAVHKHSEHDKDKKRPEKRKLVKEVDECNEKKTDDADRDQPNEKKSKRKSVDEKDESEMKKRSKFDSFKLFCKLCDVISTVPKYSDKSTAVNLFINKEGYDGDVLLLMHMLIPSTDQRVYNLKEKQLIKLFSYVRSFILTFFSLGSSSNT
ncbi:unnamed protein product [Anisakis simplex]|uniref:DNA ligase 3 (inferred by orthology to a human protein) n=1 Tax=Anisakis simplex TaxID=6269 RepID=A0A0M3J8L2_ANISI|nr:unnamed protein product [Anisakis simplex]